jgi:hypothetical protein
LPSAALLLGRREFLKAVAVVLAAAAAPVTAARRVWATTRGRFFTGGERATLTALCDRILPPDRDAGAATLGAPDYIERFLTAFDHGRVPFIYAGGPFSGRTPFPDNENGTISHRRPRNSFKRFIPLTRVQEIRWRAELFGSDKVRGADFNDAALGGPLRGLRDIYREGLARVNEVAQMMAGAPFAELPVVQQDAVLAMLDRPGVLRRDPRRGGTFLDRVIEQTLEGCFTVPEYGGNHRAQGWKMVGLEGDDQPLGYSIFSRRKDGYNERPDHPMTTPNPDEFPGGVLIPRPISADADALQDLIVTLTRAFENC